MRIVVQRGRGGVVNHLCLHSSSLWQLAKKQRAIVLELSEVCPWFPSSILALPLKDYIASPKQHHQLGINIQNMTLWGTLQIQTVART